MKALQQNREESGRIWTHLDAGIPWRSKNSLAAIHEPRNGDPFKTSMTRFNLYPAVDNASLIFMVLKKENIS
jgi:hypothetical protein